MGDKFSQGALKSSLLTAFMESSPQICVRMKQPNQAAVTEFQNVVSQAENPTVLVLAY
jgi:hypothetical protein